MAINPIQYGGMVAPQALDFTPLAELGKRYQEGQQLAGRRQVLSELGNSSDPASFGQGAMRLAQLGDIQGAQGLAAIQKSIAPETSADMQAYGLYRRQGGNLPFLDFKKQLAEAGSTKINNVVNSGYEKEYDKATGKQQAEEFINLQKQGAAAPAALANLDLMEKLTHDPNFYSGAGGQLVTRAKQAAVSMGIAGADTAAPNELFQKLASKSVLDSAGGSLGTGFSNADRDFIQGTVANISNTPEGNRQIISMSKSVQKRNVEIANRAREYARKNGGRVDQGFYQDLSDWAEKNPVFSKQPQASSPQTSQASPAAAPPEPRRAPDGNLYVPDPNRPGKYLRVIQ